MSDTFEAHYLSPWLVREVTARKDEPGIWVWAREWVGKMTTVKPARDSSVTAIMQRTTDTLATHAHHLYRGGSRQAFVRQAVSTLNDGALRAYVAGVRSNSTRIGMRAAVRDKILQRVHNQSGWLTGLSETIVGLPDVTKTPVVDWLAKDPQLAQRLGLYAGTLHATYQEGTLDGWVLMNKQEPRIIWVTGTDADRPACIHCLARDGIEYTRKTLPEFPGDGQFGTDACLGGPQCRCVLDFQPSDIILPEHEVVVERVPVPG